MSDNNHLIPNWISHSAFSIERQFQSKSKLTANLYAILCYDIYLERGDHYQQTEYLKYKIYPSVIICYCCQI